MKRTYTEEQLAAINERNRTLLVSAAAGSGKTATLTERILRRLKDEKDPLDITRMLVATFTRAAAGELRERISDALSSALAEDPKNAHLARQLLLLPAAKIRTIDSFSGEFVRQNAEALGISRRFRVAEAAEAALLSASVMERLIEDGYAGLLEKEGGPTAGEFRRLSEALADPWEERSLPAMLSSLYRKISNYPERSGLLTRLGREMRAAREEPFHTPWGKEMRHRTGLFLEDALLRYEGLSRRIPTEGSVPEQAYLPLLAAESSYFRNLQDKLAEGYAAFREAILQPLAFSDLPSVSSGAVSRLGGVYRVFREKLKAELPEEAALYRFTAPQYLAAAEEYGILHETAGRLLSLFEERFFAEKKRRGICEFNDISHMMLQLLYREDGTLSPTALHMRETFDEVYIDEYQDVNPVQHKIFEALAGERARFMVGDIKQAIYGFRGAKSDIFASMREAFPPLEEAGDSPTASLFMSCNFRSDEPILRYTNGIFRFLFGHAAKTIHYTEKDALRCGKKGGLDSNILPTVSFFHLISAKKGMPKSSPAVQREIQYIANEIERLLREGTLRNGQPIRPGDIAILLRSRSHMGDVVEALAQKGIPAEGDQTPEFFMNPEILLTLCLLNAVNNPRRDIYLAGLLRSPIYDFSMDELILLRQECPGDCLYTSVEKYVSRHPDFEKGVRFLSELARYRRLAEGMPADKLLRLLYRESGLLAMAGREEAPRNNLLLLLHYAKKFEETSFRGLYRFIHYLNEVMRTRQKLDSAMESVGQKADAVQLVTSHGSKGLQYPVVFVSCLGTQFTKGNDREPGIDLHEEMGLGILIRDPTGVGILDTPMCRVLTRSLRDREIEEEMRLLYVALTRPEERLYVTGNGRSGEKKTLGESILLREFPSEYSILTASGAMTWILSAMEEGTYEMVEAKESLPPSAARPVAPAAPSVEKPEKEDGEKTAAECESILKERFAFRYPYAAETRLPGKLSVSVLSPKLLNEDETGLFALEKEKLPMHHAPAFITPRKEDLGAKAGTATHQFLQFCDLSRLLSLGAEAELSRLLKEEFLSPEDGRLVKLPEIEAFCASPLPKEILQSQRVYREFRFHMSFPAALLTTEEKQKAAFGDSSVLVQGVIDCFYFRENGQCVLLDYKTDRLPPEALADPAKGAELLTERHGKQLAYYAAAIHRLFGRLPDEVLIYSLHSGRTIPENVNNYLQMIAYRKEEIHEAP